MPSGRLQARALAAQGGPQLLHGPEFFVPRHLFDRNGTHGPSIPFPVALPAATYWHTRHQHMPTVTGASLKLYRTAPQRHPPVSAMGCSSHAMELPEPGDGLAQALVQRHARPIADGTVERAHVAPGA